MVNVGSRKISIALLDQITRFMRYVCCIDLALLTSEKLPHCMVLPSQALKYKLIMTHPHLVHELLKPSCPNARIYCLDVNHCALKAVCQRC